MEERPSLRDHLAAERTMLSWLRTNLAIMGFGFLIARFAVQGMQDVATWFGALLIAAAAGLNLSAFRNYRRDVSSLVAAGMERPPSSLAGIVSCFLSVSGLLIAAYLLLFRP